MVPDTPQSDRRCRELLDRARANPSGLRFRELLRLAECHGFHPSRQRGSHVVLSADDAPRPLVVQDVKGRAKAYQVRQLLDAIEGGENL
jgi:predicted RNA binding protein YcfA (HicA-like mRNA interferase family)